MAEQSFGGGLGVDQVGRGEPCTADLVELVGRVGVGVDGDLAGAEHGFPWEGRPGPVSEGEFWGLW